MFDKMRAFWSLFQKGKEVTNAEMWKNGQVTGNMVGGFIIAAVSVAKGLGYDLPINEAAAYAIGGGVVAIANIVLTVITSKKVGLPTSEPIVPAVQPAYTEASANVQTESKALYTQEQLAEARKAMEESRGRNSSGQHNMDYRN